MRLVGYPRRATGVPLSFPPDARRLIWAAPNKPFRRRDRVHRRPRGPQPEHGPAELGPVRFGQRQPAPLQLAADALAQADPAWLAGLITRQAPIGRWADAYTRQPDDIKTVLNFSDGAS